MAKIQANQVNKATTTPETTETPTPTSAENTTQPNSENVELQLAGVPESDRERFAGLMRVVPGESVVGLQKMLLSMNPNKKGFEEGTIHRWTPVQLRVYQPTSTKDVPPAAKHGDLYTSLGDVFPQPLIITPIFMYSSHAKFEEDTARPSCSSEDGKFSYSGKSCAECDDFPFKHGQRTMCSKSLNALAFTHDMSSIVRISFSKTSAKAGAHLIDLAGHTEYPWSQWYALRTKETPRSGGLPGKYYIMNIDPAGEEVDVKLRPMIEFFCDKVTGIRKATLEDLASRRAAGVHIRDGIGATGEELPAEGAKTGNDPDFSAL